jgi:hypothetical protein
MHLKRRFTFLLLVFALLPLLAVQAVEPINKSRFNDVAIKGYDPVAYFNQGGSARGDKKITHEWSGATWRFASEENRDLFKSDPETYAPQYGGYCAYAVSEGSTASIDPKAWSIVEGKLYLNYNLKIHEKWSKDLSGRIIKGDANWPGILAK